MASTRKKQDEKHVKVLRSLVSLPGNKECFDCGQRGPTYVNVTIGSFVCTSCSGLLRGLTPPHRVKSISMAVFTPEEIEIIKSRGNEYCKKVWLYLYVPNQHPNSKNEQHGRDFMIAKYERKQYYAEPSLALTNTNGIVSTSNITNTFPTQWETSANETVKQKKQDPSLISPLPVQSPPQLPKINNTMFKTDNTVNFGTVDPFGPVVQQQNPQEQFSFANFDNNPIFSNSAPSPVVRNMTSSASFPSAGKQKPPTEDRYAALKDLDCLMKIQQDPPVPAVDWSTSAAMSANASWQGEQLAPAAAATTAVSPSNPFQLPTTENNTVRNPFRNNVELTNGNSTWANSNPWATATLPTSQSMPFNNTSWPGNANITIRPGPGNSNNPFL